MECLTKSINKAAQEGALLGVRLAPTAPTLTHSIYANDLVVMGSASVSEAGAYMAIFDQFGSYSGLVVNPEKSTLWFSKRCSERERNDILRVMNAKVAEERERYLGVVLVLVL